MLASYREGLPKTVREGIAMGVPIVSSVVDGVEEAVRHEKEALLVAPKKVVEKWVVICTALHRSCDSEMA